MKNENMSVWAVFLGSIFSQLAMGEIDYSKFISRGDLYLKRSDTSPVFRFERKESTVSKTREVKTIYETVDRVSALEETYTYQDSKLVQLKVVQHQLGEKYEMKLEEGRLKFSLEKTGKNAKTASEKLSGELIGGDQIAPFVQTNWSSFVKDKKSFSIRFPALDRLETVGFDLKHIGTKTIAGVQLEEIEMKATSPFIRLIVDPIIFRFESTEPHWLKEFEGRVVPKNKKGDVWKDLDALTVFTHVKL